MNIQTQIQQMARAITMTPEFIRFRQARSRILADPVVGKNVIALEQTIQGIMKRSPSDATRQIEQLTKNNQDLFKRPEVNEFMISSRAFSQAMANAVSQLYQSMDSYLGGRS